MRGDDTMGGWSRSEFERDSLPARAYFIAGASPRGVVEHIVGCFDRTLFQDRDVYERYILADDGEEFVLCFQLYGAPIVCDLLGVLKDGGVKEVIFLGAAGALADHLSVGDYVLPAEIRCLDGVATALGAELYARPDGPLRARLGRALADVGEEYVEGPTVSVPAVLWHGDRRRRAPEAIAVEIELAAFCHCAERLDLPAAGLLVISDTADHTLRDNQDIRYTRTVAAFKALSGKTRGG
jgi:uridine phosphorylase